MKSNRPCLECLGICLDTLGLPVVSYIISCFQRLDSGFAYIRVVVMGSRHWPSVCLLSEVLFHDVCVPREI
jgi:hypothetical protein